MGVMGLMGHIGRFFLVGLSAFVLLAGCGGGGGGGTVNNPPPPVSAGFSSPVGSWSVISPYKDSRYANVFPGKWHKGTDINAGRATPVRALARGVVTEISIDGQDTAVMIRHRSVESVPTSSGPTRDFYAVYGHITPSVQLGNVASGQQIGVVGPYDTGSHLHLGIRVGQSIVDAWGRGELVNGKIPAGDAYGLTDGWADAMVFLQRYTPDNGW